MVQRISGRLKLHFSRRRNSDHSFPCISPHFSPCLRAKLFKIKNGSPNWMTRFLFFANQDLLGYYPGTVACSAIRFLSIILAWNTRNY